MENINLRHKFQSILDKNKMEHTIVNVTISDSSHLIGEHMASLINFAKLEFEDRKPMYLFIKKGLPCSDPLEAKMFEECMIKEGSFLVECVGKLVGICEKLNKNFGDELKACFPEVLFANEEEIIMEDLKHAECYMTEKLVGQDFQHAIAVMKGLAKFHGASYALIKEHGGSEAFVEKHRYTEDMYGKPELKQIFDGMFQSPMEGMFSMLKSDNSQETRQTYQKLEKYEGKVVDTIIETAKCPGLFNVVNHGDCWNNNMMFKDVGQDKQVVFFDFQGTRVASPCCDLAYYFFSSVQPNVKSQWKTLLKIYFEEFVKTTEILHQNFQFTFEEFIEEFSNRALFGFFFGIFMIIGLEAVSTYDVGDNADKELWMDGMSKRVTDWIVNNPDKKREMIRKIVELVQICEEINPKAFSIATNSG